MSWVKRGNKAREGVDVWLASYFPQNKKKKKGRSFFCLQRGRGSAPKDKTAYRESEGEKDAS